MTSTNQSRSLGIALVLAASFGYALQLPLRHLAELQGTSSLQLVFLATLAASVIILPTLPWCLKNRPPWIGVLVLACGRGMAISGYFQALQTLPPSLAVMFFFSGPLLVLLQTTVFRLEKLTLMQFTSFFIGISGLALALDSSLNVEELTGVLWALFGGLGLSWEYIAVRVWIPLNKAISGTLLSIIASSALVMPMAWYFDSAHLPPTLIHWYPVILLSVFALILPTALLLKGIVHAGANTASLLTLAEPVFTIAIALFFGWDSPTFRTWVGMLLLLSALGLAAYRKEDSPETSNS